jgi:hypothetical protein
MANSLNSNPIVIDTDITSWRAQQTLNSGKSPATLQNPSPSLRQWGIRPFKIVIQSASTTTVAGVITVLDPNDSTVLLPKVAVAGSTASADGDYLLTEDFEGSLPSWRDFAVTGVTATATRMLIWYRT